MSIQVTDPYSYDVTIMPDQAYVADKPTHSTLLGPDGKPLAYRQPPVGFDLRPTKEKNP